MATSPNTSQDAPPVTEQSNVVIYTRPFCGFCSRAISVLRQKGVAFIEIEAGFDPALRQEMIERSGRTTFPQIFVGDTHIGGCDDLLALDSAGKFDPMLHA
ncbi:MAG: glutaredoxin 3 [Caulobacteraceae bacterium]|nr:glutaredoxin 3 [Caulobacteraceae bacterium]